MADDDKRVSMNLINRLTEPAIRAAIAALQLPPASRGLDVACGVGNHARWLAAAVGAQGHVTGLDADPELVGHARKSAASAGLWAATEFVEGDLGTLPFDDATFDWAWAFDVLWAGPRELGYSTADPHAAVAEIARTVRPGGTVAVGFWTAQRLLPGESEAEARLDHLRAEQAQRRSGAASEHDAARAVGWLRDAGLADVRAASFNVDVVAPLGDITRRALLRAFDMLWAGPCAAAPEADKARAVYERYCNPDSPDCVLARDDYHGIVTYAVTWGRVPMP